jgi:hypothetical protein
LLISQIALVPQCLDTFDVFSREAMLSRPAQDGLKVLRARAERVVDELVPGNVRGSIQFIAAINWLGFTLVAAHELPQAMISQQRLEIGLRQHPGLPKTRYDRADLEALIHLTIPRDACQ